ncbi:hypothetical protein BU14_1676s0003 [Porphyra umbilicalis]|uniref:Uncharacterized protein n=1 Tax=Porphyra umbilicalis TaxID=2786 RepID=A0A1X6NL17_PORUM|nr:hypothetical protein BU14_1676s0003 [Porphyra umbilicalis]|eukprot:OSX69272.1 hypothetical protein BU14_1676s0003 [Porphyra umbilicalis]
MGRVIPVANPARVGGLATRPASRVALPCSVTPPPPPPFFRCRLYRGGAQLPVPDSFPLVHPHGDPLRTLGRRRRPQDDPTLDAPGGRHWLHNRHGGGLRRGDQERARVARLHAVGRHLWHLLCLFPRLLRRQGRRPNARLVGAPVDRRRRPVVDRRLCAHCQKSAAAVGAARVGGRGERRVGAPRRGRPRPLDRPAGDGQGAR